MRARGQVETQPLVQKGCAFPHSKTQRNHGLVVAAAAAIGAGARGQAVR